MLASLLYPYDDDASTEIVKWLEELEKEQCIRRYALGADQFIQICNWLKHQKIDKPSSSKCPPPPEISPNGSDHSRVTRERSRGVAVGREGTGEEGKGSGREGTHPRANGALGPGLAETFDAFWRAYPKRKAKGDAERAWAKLRPDRELAERIVSAVKRATTCPDWVRDAGRYIPHPATWLNDKRWEDDLADVKAETAFDGLV
jgi:hypothetical protein